MAIKAGLGQKGVPRVRQGDMGGGIPLSAGGVERVKSRDVG